MQLCLALKYCHDNKVLHLDIKTANVFLDENDNIKLGDFGMARNLEHTAQLMTNFAGTPLYLPPEIINGQPYSFKADMWSLGVVLFELASLTVPFLDLNFPLLLLKICSAKTPELPCHYSPQLRGFIASLLQKEQELRMDINGVFQDPFITTAYFRQGRFDGLRLRDWLLFLASVVVSNAYWTLRSGAVATLLVGAWRWLSHS